MLSVSFSPLVPDYALWALSAAVVVLAILALASRGPVALIRAVALGLVLVALANPSLVQEDREKVKDIVAVVVDRSQSQTLGDRIGMTETVRQELQRRFGNLTDFEPRFIGADPGEGDEGTRLFTALSNGLADVPPNRLAGVLMITDGVVHDIPASVNSLGFNAPLHALITGRPNERDRQIKLLEAPRFGIVGKDQTIRAQVEERGGTGSAQLTVRRDGQVFMRQPIRTGTPFSIQVRVEHGGQNVVELEVEPLENELTQANNRAVVAIEGIREKLRVLLVSGEPHAGERTWRNLLKSDANVDLVHFTILRPQEKQDGTPVNELSLIAFPTRALFQEKIKDFDLIVFDRYANQNVLLPSTYFENIVRYVRDGGAVMIAAGPEFAGNASLARTRLSSIIPGNPDGRIVEQPYKARVTQNGARHPVTRELPGSEQDPPAWGEWLRIVGAQVPANTALMSGANDLPLLVLRREEKGRVALMLSDHAWLWARGFREGGPHLDLLRRMAHWLMKEPALEEEALRASAAGRDIRIERQTMRETADPVTLTTPGGAQRTITLDEEKPGLFTARTESQELGLHTLRSGDLVAFVSIGPPNPRELADVFSNPEPLRAIAEATGGSVRRVAAETGDVTVPRILPVRSGSRFAGGDWVGLRPSESAVVRGVSILPLALGLLGLILLIGATVGTWVAEGRRSA